MLGGAADYITHAEPGGAAKLIHNENPVVIEGYSTDVFADRAIEWISRQRTAPYFLYLSLNAPHFPYQAPEHGPASIPWKEGGGWPTQETYRKMVERMDARIADVLAVVDRSPGAANTIVIFTSDNGATATLGSNRPLRGHKGQLYEGGIRVPCLIRWPQVIPAGKTVSQVTLLMDLTATLLAASKVKPPLPLDGIDLRKVLDGTSQDISRTVFWRWQKGKPPVKAVRQEDFKLIVDSGTNHRELYDLAVDPLESSDLFEAMPAKAKALGHLMDTWELEVQAPRLKEFRLLGRQSN